MDERLKRVFDSIYTELEDFDVTAYITKEPVPYSERKSGTERALKTGDRWGSLWDCAWMNFKGEIPDIAEGKNVTFLIDVGGEGCVFDRNGVPYRGITNKDSFYSFELGMPGKVAVPFSRFARGGEKIDFWVDCGANDLFGERADAPFEPIGVLHKACIAECNEEIESLYYDLEVILYLRNATEDEKVKAMADRALTDAFNAWDTNIKLAKQITTSFLSKKSESDFHITALGHAHIDLAWLWPIRETKRKAERTFSTVIRNSEKYEDYIFGVSQPQLLDWVKKRQPELFDEMKALYNKGRLELQGGFWVESDTNIPCGESLMRQMLYGKKFFRDEFGYEQEILWIPDVFGYSAQLPQIMKQFGIKYFLTIKMSWNSVNLFPYSTFNWTGLDGSTVLTHMPPEGNYNSALRSESLLSTEKKFRERDIDNRAMLLYGIGDGGGGPGEEHLERFKREKDLIGLPKVSQGKAIDFFKDIEKDREKFPEYKGELYLEKHQGTYTTQSANKRNNRKCEFLLHNAELLCVASAYAKNTHYPKEDFENLWKEVLLYQFHDIIPGSSIKRVYDETDERYAYIKKELEKIIKNAEKALCGEEDKECIFNPAPYKFSGFVRKGDSYIYAEAEPMSFSYTSEYTGEAAKAGEKTLENNLLKITFNEDGSIGSVIRKKDSFEAFKGRANILTIYEDNENAWEVPKDYRENRHRTLKAEKTVFEIINGVAERTSVYKYGNSVIKQKIILAPDSERIDFYTEVEWQETHRMLRSAFPVSVKNDSAQCDIQYGCIDRPTHTRDSFAKAKKEICAHRFIDISDDKNGVSIMSDCKYGYRIWDCVLDIDLLRSSMYPGVDADKGHRVFTYSVFVHEKDYKNGAAKEAYFLNNKPFFVKGAA